MQLVLHAAPIEAIPLSASCRVGLHGRQHHEPLSGRGELATGGRQA